MSNQEKQSKCRARVEMEDSHQRRLSLLLSHLCPPAPHLHHHLVNQCYHPSPPGLPVVVGSMVLDIHAVPYSKELRPGTTTPGRVQYVRGGVARNVAECMNKLGMLPFLISVVGQDMAGEILLNHWQSLGLSIDGIQRCTGVATPVVSVIFDGKGEVAEAVADIHAVEELLTPEWIGQFGAAIRSASFVMLDANLNPSALEAACKLAKEANVPIWFEPVSVSKSLRYKTISNYINYASPNAAELVAMADVLCSKIEDKIPLGHLMEENNGTTIIALVQQLRPYILVLLQSGIEYIALTLGRHGVVLCSQACKLPKSSHENKCKEIWRTPTKSGVRHSKTMSPHFILEDSSRVVGQSDECSNGDRQSPRMEAQNDPILCPRSLDVCYLHFPALPASVVNLSGAGDCFVAGALTSLCMHKDIRSSMAYGVAAARQAIQSELNVPSLMPQIKLIADAGAVLESATLLLLS